MDQQGNDQELSSIQQILSALEKLDDAARQRVLTYVIERFEISLSRTSLRRYTTTPAETSNTGDEIVNQTPFSDLDIRKLKETKVPETAVEMAILVAYYLSELAPIAERKSTINASDLSIYFKQAKFPLPKSIKDILPYAKKSGYLETVAQGEYRLNSVGYNLAVHGLPRIKQ